MEPISVNVVGKLWNRIVGVGVCNCHRVGRRSGNPPTRHSVWVGPGTYGQISRTSIPYTAPEQTFQGMMQKPVPDLRVQEN
jgi:hypothetical protein